MTPFTIPIRVKTSYTYDFKVQSGGLADPA